jgi:hypothetical protein
MMRKGLRSKLDSLPPEQRAQLVKWLEEGATYREALDRLQKHFGVKSCQRAMSSFWHKAVAPALDWQYLLKETVLEVTLRARQSGKVIGETNLRVHLDSTAATGSEPVRPIGQVEQQETSPDLTAHAP